MLEILQVLIGRTDKDAILNYLIVQAQCDFKAYCNRTDVPAGTDDIIIQMVLVKWNRLGAEGLGSESFSGVSNNYIDGYPANITAALNNYRKMKIL